VERSYIALECAQLLARFGCHVTLLQRSSRILPTEAADLTDTLTSYLSSEGMEIVTGVSIQRIKNEGNSVVVEVAESGGVRNFKASRILIATGREPNTRSIGLEENGVLLNEKGFIKLIRDRSNDKLVGARILAPEGSELLMEVSLAIKYEITVKELVSAFYPYLTLGEGLKLAAITFGKSVEKLSCCAT